MTQIWLRSRCCVAQGVYNVAPFVARDWQQCQRIKEMQVSQELSAKQIQRAWRRWQGRAQRVVNAFVGYPLMFSMGEADDDELETANITLAEHTAELLNLRLELANKRAAELQVERLCMIIEDLGSALARKLGDDKVERLCMTIEDLSTALATKLGVAKVSQSGSTTSSASGSNITNPPRRPQALESESVRTEEQVGRPQGPPLARFNFAPVHWDCALPLQRFRESSAAVEMTTFTRGP